jgi:rod shape-determining protein MreC
MFATRRRTLSLLLIVSLGHVLLISVQVQSKSGAPMLEAVPFAAFAQLQRATGAFGGGISGAWNHYIALGGVARENEALHGRVTELETALQAEHVVANSARSLEEVLGLQQTLPVTTMAARVIAFDPSADFLTVMIDRGTADGVGGDMAVLAADGVVGKVLGHPLAHAAQVQLLIGRNAGAGATLERVEAEGVVKGGAGSPPLEMSYVSNAKDVRPGDRVLTSGHDGIFPPGFPIGVVEKADRGSGMFRSIRIRPAVDYSHLGVVLVVVDRLQKPAKPVESPNPAPGRGRGGL